MGLQVCAGFIFSLHRLGGGAGRAGFGTPLQNLHNLVECNKMTRSASSVQGANGSKTNVEYIPALRELALSLAADGTISPIVD